MPWSTRTSYRPAPEAGPTWVLDLSGILVLALGLFGCLLVAVGVVGCEGQGARAELFEIESVGPDRIEAGRRIVVEGLGFPDHGAGVSGAELRLLGALHQPGETIDVALALPAEVISSQRAEALVTGGFLEGIGDGSGRATFRGRVELVVPMADSAGLVVGHLDDVVLDLIPSRALGRIEDETLGLERDPPPGSDEASASLAARALLGIELDESTGVFTVVSTEPDRLGASFALRPGDELVALDGLRVVLGSDLSGWGTAPLSSIEVLREGQSVTLSPASRVEGSNEVEHQGLVLSVLLLLLAVLVRERDRAVEATRRAGSLGRLSLPWLALGLGVFAGAHELLRMAGVDRLPMLLAPSVALVVLAGSVEGSSPFAVLVALGRALLLLLVLVAATAMAPFGDLRELEATQSLMPWTWPLVATPVAPAFVVLLATALTFSGTRLERGLEASVLDRATLPRLAPRMAASVVALAAEATAVLLLVVSVAGGRGEASLLGAIGFAVRAVMLFCLLRAVSAVLLSCARRTRIALVLASLLATLAFLAMSMRMPLPDGAAHIAAELWLAGLLMGALLLLRPRPLDPLSRELAL